MVGSLVVGFPSGIIRLNWNDTEKICMVGSLVVQLRLMLLGFVAVTLNEPS